MNGEQTLVFLCAIGWYVMRLLDEEHARTSRPSPGAAFGYIAEAGGSVAPCSSSSS